MDGCVGGCVEEWMWMDGWIDVCGVGGCVDGWMGRCVCVCTCMHVVGWVDEWVDGCLYMHACVHAWQDEQMVEQKPSESEGSH